MATKDRGFASMDPEKQRAIASKGGKAAHQKGTAHEWTSEEAVTAGRKGGANARGGRGKLPDPGPSAVTEHVSHNAGGVVTQSPGEEEGAGATERSGNGV